MDDAARKVANCMEDEPGEMTRQEIIDEVAFTFFDEVVEYFDAYHYGKLEPDCGHDSEIGRGAHGQTVRIRRQALGQGSGRGRRRAVIARRLH